jgi:hypothetical protein
LQVNNKIRQIEALNGAGTISGIPAAQKVPHAADAHVASVSAAYAQSAKDSEIERDLRVVEHSRRVTPRFANK